MNEAWSHGAEQGGAEDPPEVAPMLAAMRRMRAEAPGIAEAAPSYETMRWLFDLACHPAFPPPAPGQTGAPAGVQTAPLAGALDLLLAAAGRGDLAALLLGALRTLPLRRAQEVRGVPATRAPLPDLFAGALLLLLGPADPARPPPREAAMVVLQGLEDAAEELAEEAKHLPGARFLVLATQLCLALRLGAAPRHKARLLDALAALVQQGAALAAGGLAEAEAREARIRAMLSDPALAMRMHYLVPRRSLTAETGGGLRKGFAREDALAAAARDRLRQAAEAISHLRADLAGLDGLDRLLRAEAAALPA